MNATRVMIDQEATPRPVSIMKSIFLASIFVLFLFLLSSIHRSSSTAWYALVILFVVVSSMLSAATVSGPLARLMKYLGVLCGVYAVFHYPFMPVADRPLSVMVYGAVVISWIASFVSIFLCFKRPILSAIPAAYITWSAEIADHVTGLSHNNTLDVLPLTEVTIALALGTAIIGVVRAPQDRPGFRDWPGSSIKVGDQHIETFKFWILWVAISIHLANYFWSSVAKYQLHGPFLAWITDNNPLYIYLAAINDHHITFSELPFINTWLPVVLDRTHLVSNTVIFFIQGLALFGMLLPKRFLLLLVLFFDVMHVSIAIAVGANFWPWIMLNVAIALIVASPAYRQPPKIVGVVLVLFIVAAKFFMSVAYLGWFDSGANNVVSIEAVSRDGQRYYVSPNYFTFYSYPIAHMDYGDPDPSTAFNVGNPNGGVSDLALLRAGQSCDIKRLVVPGSRPPMNPAFGDFLVRYHTLMLKAGSWPFNVYPHHFYVRPSLSKAFADVDKRSIVAYVVHRDSVCLSFADGKTGVRVINSAERRYEVPGG